MIRAGRHDQKLTFQRLTTVNDGMGSVTEEWEPFHSCWGEVTIDRSAEAIDAGQRTGLQWFIMSTRADSKSKTITATDRVQWDGRDFDLSPPRPFPAGRPERIEFTATARAN